MCCIGVVLVRCFKVVCFLFSCCFWAWYRVCFLVFVSCIWFPVISAAYLFVFFVCFPAFFIQYFVCFLMFVVSRVFVFLSVFDFLCIFCVCVRCPAVLFFFGVILL